MISQFRRDLNEICALLESYAAYRGADKSLARPGRKQANISVRMAWISFGALPCRKRNLMTARVSILLKSRASLTCFRACFLPGRAKDLSAPRYSVISVPTSSCPRRLLETWGQDRQFVPKCRQRNVILCCISSQKRADLKCHLHSTLLNVYLFVRPSVWQNVTHRETIQHFNRMQCSFAKPYRRSPVSIETTETGQEKHIMRISSLNAFQNLTVKLQIFIGHKRASTHFPSSTNILSFIHFSLVFGFRNRPTYT